MSDSAVRLDLDESGIATLTLDDPAKSTNTMNDAYWAGMDAAVEQLRAAGDALRGVVVTSAKKTFFAGGDLVMLAAARPGDEERLRTVVQRSSRQLRELETLGVPVVAAIAGAALGGGLEIALACHHRIAVDSPKIKLGLPEVTMGLLPAANGLIRTVRLLGLGSALSSVLLTGQTYTPSRAAELGLIDELVSTPDDLIPAARRWIESNPNSSAPWDRDGFTVAEFELGSSESDVVAGLTQPAKRALGGYPLPAPRAILSVALQGASVDFAAASDIEAEAFIELVTGQVSTNLIQANFFDMQTIRSGNARPTGSDKFRAQKVAVIGAGMMGSGIAEVCVRSGMDAVLVDRDTAAAERGRAGIEKNFAKAVKSGSMDTAKAEELLAKVRPSADYADIAQCDLIIEAVFEDENLKHSIFGSVDEALETDALLASNTSTLPITGLSGATKRPGDFIGLHFFSPVPRMPLVEVIAGAATEPKTLAKGIDVVTQLGKIPIVVSDSRGFFTSRVIVKRLVESMAMISEGIDPALIERAAVGVGYPVGPLTLLDELTVSLVDTVRVQARAAAEDAGTQWVTHPGDDVAAAMVHKHSRPGRVAGGGFYDYENGARGDFWAGLAEYRTSPEPTIDQQTVADRLVFAEVVDSFNCLHDGVLKTTADANVGSLLGIGFPAWTGGVIQFAAGYPGGPDAFASRAKELSGLFGPRFDLPETWQKFLGDSA